LGTSTNCLPGRDGASRGAAYIAQVPPLTSTFGEAEAMAQKIRAGFESS